MVSAQSIDLIDISGRVQILRLVSECKESLSGLVRNYDIRLCWVPGHCDIEGNEVANEIARYGCSNLSLPEERSVKLPIGHYFGLIKKRDLREILQYLDHWIKGYLEPLWLS